MKNIFSIFIFGVTIFCFTNCNQSIVSIDDEKCGCDSVLREKNPFYNKYSCFFNNKKVIINKSLNGDTVEIKKYYLNTEGRYQKFEYLTLIKNKIDYNQSAFVDIDLNEDFADIRLSSNNYSQNIYIILDNSILSNKGNHIKISLDNLKTINVIQKRTDKMVNNDSIKKITQIVDYFYSYKDITEEMTLIKLYTKLVKSGIIK